MELANQPSQGIFPEEEAEHWEGPSIASMSSYPLICMNFLHSYVKGWRGISALLASVDLSVKEESTNLFPRIKWAHGDETC